MIEEKKISVIVPIYNVEKYLEKCINSIVFQTYKNIEILLIDDGSTDKSSYICEEWKKRDSRINVVHKANGGLSDARNCGLNIASGEYVCFIDSDDYIENDYIEKLYKILIENKLRVSQCGINYINENDKKLKQIGYRTDIVLKGREIIKDSCDKHFIENEVVWNRLYDIKIFENLRFPKGKIHEDEYITYKILYNEDKIAITAECLYKYRQSNNSIMRSKYSIKKFRDFSEAYKEKIMYFKEREDIELYDMVIRSYLSNLSNIFIKIKKNIPNSRKYLEEIKEEYRYYFKYVINSKNLALKNKIKISIFYCSPLLYTGLKELKERI